jgi:hypothetical protein
MKRSPSHISRVIDRLRLAWADMDYAQRRLFEIQTGIPVAGPQPRRHRRPTVEELEALYAIEQAEVHARLTPHGR